MKKLTLILILLSIICLTTSAQQIEITEEILNQFEEFKQKYDKIYHSIAEHQHRLEVFAGNLKYVAELQTQQTGNTEYGITKFSDMTLKEFKEQILLPPQKAFKFEESRYMKLENKIENPPESFDWKDKGAVTEIKNQGSVGTCWAFSTTGNIEGVWQLAGNPLISVSEQQISDCDSTTDPKSTHADCGVFGGWPYLALQYVIKAGGLPADKDYPYCVGIPGKNACYPCSAPGYNKTLCGPGLNPPSCNDTLWPCKQGKVPIAVKIDDWKAIPQDENEILNQLLVNGPFSVALDAEKLQFYKKGVFAPHFCSKTDLDHAVLLTGYGVEPKSVHSQETPFWNVKNSWGPNWGEDGYFRITRGTGQCGINTQVVTAVIHKNQQKQTEIKE